MDFIYALQNALERVISFIPNILWALILFLLALAVAAIVKKLAKKLMVKAKLDEKLSKGQEKESDYGEKRLDDISQLIYYLVVLFFIPSIFSALNLTVLSSPISSMMNNLFAYLPNLIGAGIVLYIGYFVAKIVKDLSFAFFRAVKVDRWLDKVSPQDQAGTPVQEKKTSLASILSKLLFGLVLIPVITAGLEMLSIQSLTQPILLVLNKIMDMVPNVLVATALIIIGYYVAGFVAKLLEGFLERVGINKIFDWMKSPGKRQMVKVNLASIIGGLVRVIILLFIIVEALSILRLDVLNVIGASIIGYLPLLISGLLIIGLGLVAGTLVQGLINKYMESPFTAAIAKYTIIVFAVFMTLAQIRFASTIVNVAFLLILGGLSVAFALAFGLGGRDFAGRQLDRFEEKVQEENKKPVPKDNIIDKIDKA